MPTGPPQRPIDTRLVHKVYRYRCVTDRLTPKLKKPTVSANPPRALSSPGGSGPVAPFDGPDAGGAATGRE